MTWTKPEFSEITLNMEVTAYVNTGDEALPTCDAAMFGSDVDAGLLDAGLFGTSVELVSA